MKQTNISIRIDEDIKKDVETLCSKIGLSLSAVTNVFYRQFVRTQGIPFLVTAIDINPQMQARRELKETFKAMQEQSITNGTDNLTLEEINDIINECRQEEK